MSHFYRYIEFKDKIRLEYPVADIDHLTFEDGLGYWRDRAMDRWYRLCSAVYDAHLNGTFTVLDVGAFPFTALKVVKVLFPGAKLIGAGLWSENVTRILGSDPILKDGQFQLCNFDPWIMLPEEKQGVPKHIDLPDSSVDFIIFTEVIEHLYNPGHILKEISRLLKPGGRIYLTTNNVSFWFFALRLLWGETNLDRNLDQITVDFSDNCPHDWRGHVRFYSAGQLKEMLTKVGIPTVIRSTSFDNYDIIPGQKPGSRLLRTWVKEAIKIMPFMNHLRAHIEIVAEK